MVTPEWPPLPSTPANLMEALRSPQEPGGPLTLEVARQLGATRTCTTCGAEVVDSTQLSEIVGAHFQLNPPARNELREAIEASGLEIASRTDAAYCASHARVGTT
jgi:hypothetical protein